MKKEIQRLIKEYEQNLKDMAGANVECRENYGRDIFSEDHMNTVKAFLYDLYELNFKLAFPNAVRPYDKKDYLKAQSEGFNLDDWDDYQKFYQLGEQEEEY